MFRSRTYIRNVASKWPMKKLHLPRADKRQRYWIYIEYEEIENGRGASRTQTTDKSTISRLRPPRSFLHSALSRPSTRNNAQFDSLCIARSYRASPDAFANSFCNSRDVKFFYRYHSSRTILQLVYHRCPFALRSRLTVRRLIHAVKLEPILLWVVVLIVAILSHSRISISRYSGAERMFCCETLLFTLRRTLRRWVIVN